VFYGRDPTRPPFPVDFAPTPAKLTAMSPDLLKTVFLPLALISIMFGMGMSLTPADFKRVVLSPRATILGLICQLVALPLLAFALIWLFRLPGDLAVGLMILAACPGGPTSNIITHLSRGDTALSVTLTAVSSVITVFTIPLLVGFAIRHFLDADEAIVLPFLKTVGQLIVVTLIPIALGMWVNRARPVFARRMASTVNVISLIFLALVILAAVLREKDLGQQFLLAGPAALALNLASMALGLGAAALFRLTRPQGISISIESGIQNGTLALSIALGLLDSSRIAMPAVVYSLLMFASGAIMIFWFGRRRGEQ
jgi:BASS family bile acid:Na+ symporter